MRANPRLNICVIITQKSITSIAIYIDMKIDKNIVRLKELLQSEIHEFDGEHKHEDEVIQLIKGNCEILLDSYDAYRKYGPAILSLYEAYNTHVIDYLLHIFMDLLSKQNELKPCKSPIIKRSITYDFETTFNDFLNRFKTTDRKSVQLRISDQTDFGLETSTSYNYLEMISEFINRFTIEQTKDPAEHKTMHLFLWATRNIGRELKQPELFYHYANSYLTGLFAKEKYQLARDVTEEVLYISYQDNLPEFGFSVSYTTYSKQSSSIVAIQHAIMAITAFLKKGSISDFFLTTHILEGIRYLRNTKMPQLAIQVFEARPKVLNFGTYDKNTLYHLYFSCLLFIGNDKMPSMALDYIGMQKEIILKTGDHEALPWLVMLFNIQRNYATGQYDSETLNQYVELFKRVVSPEKYEKEYRTLFGGLAELKTSLKDSLINLSHTRYPTDFATDNKAALQIADSTIEESFVQKDVDGYLLAMIVRSDYSTVFIAQPEKLTEELRKNLEIRKFEEQYTSPLELVKFINELNNCCVLWLGSDKEDVLPLFYDGNEFIFIDEQPRLLSQILSFCQTHLSSLPHNDKRPGPRHNEKNDNDYAMEEAEIRTLVSFFEFPIELVSTTQLLIIKDIRTSAFPHNLITTHQGFVSKFLPVTNIMSAEWLFKNWHSGLPKKLAIQLWIPTESGDMTINLMHSRMDDYLSNHPIIQFTGLLPETPLSGDINIVVAHGNKEISTFPAFFMKGDNKTFLINDFDHIIGQGTILILFVCHSGSEKSDTYRNQVNTIIKEFLSTSYKAVIAPFWALNIDIPPIWLPEFLLRLEEGVEISQAVFLANQLVCSYFNTPKAYACLHLYGNPFLKVCSG